MAGAGLTGANGRDSIKAAGPGGRNRLEGAV
jgi:hypothetical protein